MEEVLPSNARARRLRRARAELAARENEAETNRNLWRGDSRYDQEFRHPARHNEGAMEMTISPSLRMLLGWLQIGVWWIAGLTFLGIALAAGFLTLAEQRFTSETKILVDPTNLNLVGNDIFNQNTQRDAQLMSAESKLGVLTSGNVFSQVVNTLELDKDREFADLSNSADAKAEAMQALGKKIEAFREDRSFIVSVYVTTNEASKSVQIADTLVSAFQEELAKGDADSAGRAAGALESRLAILKSELAVAEEAVESFKRENNLRVRSGNLINAELASQFRERLVAAQSRFFMEQAKYNEMLSLQRQNSISASGNYSETLSALQVEYADLKKQFSSQSVILGPRHPNLLVLQPQLTELESQIQAEMARFVSQAKAEMQEAEAVLKALNTEVESTSDSVFQDGETQVKLRQLERDADAKAAIYEAFLSRAGEATQRQQIDSNNVRVITQASLPTSRSWPPRSVVVLGAGAILGFGVGVALVVFWGLVSAVDWSRVLGGRRARIV